MEDRLLETAFRVFVNSGFRGATTRRIAAEAGLNEVTLFRHFKTKEDLIVAALEHHAARMKAVLAAHRLPDVPANVRQELAAYMGFILATMTDAHQAHRISLGEWGQNPAIDEHLLKTTTAVFDEVNRYLAAAQDVRLIRGDFSSQIVTQALLGILFADGLVRPTLPGYYEEDPGTSARAYCAMLIEGILTQTSGVETKD